MQSPRQISEICFSESRKEWRHNQTTSDKPHYYLYMGTVSVDLGRTWSLLFSYTFSPSLNSPILHTSTSYQFLRFYSATILDMASSSTEEGAGVAPQNKGSWTSFLKVRQATIITATELQANFYIVHRKLQWRSLVFDCPSLYPRCYLPHRVLFVLGRTSFNLGCTSCREGSSKKSFTSTQVVPKYAEATIL